MLRFLRLLRAGVAGIVAFLPQGGLVLAGRREGEQFGGWLRHMSRRGVTWPFLVLTAVFDVAGGPELVQFVWHLLTVTQRLSEAQIAAAAAVMGGGAIRYGDVRVARRGFLRPIFALNKGRPFATFHTINLVSGRDDLGTVVHELVHVYQYERTGSVYIGQALHAQATLGENAYRYGGPLSLRQAWAEGQRLRHFNREQQAQIAEDYYRQCVTADPPAHCRAYELFIDELRAGRL